MTSLPATMHCHATAETLVNAAMEAGMTLLRR